MPDIVGMPGRDISCDDRKFAVSGRIENTQTRVFGDSGDQILDHLADIDLYRVLVEADFMGQRERPDNDQGENNPGDISSQARRYPCSP